MNFAELDELTDKVIGAAIRIHKSIGPGLFESVYEALLEAELTQQGLHVLRQQQISFEYNQMAFENAFRVDLLVEGALLIELKSVEVMKPVYQKQVLTYLRLMQYQLGLLINFGGETIREGLHRVVNDFQPGPNSPLRINKPTPSPPKYAPPAPARATSDALSPPSPTSRCDPPVLPA